MSINKNILTQLLDYKSNSNEKYMQARHVFVKSLSSIQPKVLGVGNSKGGLRIISLYCFSGDISGCALLDSLKGEKLTNVTKDCKIYKDQEEFLSEWISLDNYIFQTHDIKLFKDELIRNMDLIFLRNPATSNVASVRKPFKNMIYEYDNPDKNTHHWIFPRNKKKVIVSMRKFNADLSLELLIIKMINNASVELIH